MKLAFLGASALAALWAGCGGEVVLEQDTGGSGGGISGSGGAGGSAPLEVCGGKTGAPCPPGAFCKYSPAGSCGLADQTGVCVPKPLDCDHGCNLETPVCGCDGQMYCSVCVANLAGVDVGSAEGCFISPPPQDEYQAWALFTNAPRYAITKADFIADTCSIVVVSGTGGGVYPNLQCTMGWSVEMAGITAHASACQAVQGSYPTIPGFVPAADGKGIIKQDSINLPCALNFDFSLFFPPGTTAPSVDTFTAGSVFVSGSCPK